jgi:hypothetical protein
VARAAWRETTEENTNGPEELILSTMAVSAFIGVDQRPSEASLAADER